MAEQGLTYKISADVTDALSKLKKLQSSIENSSKHINNLGTSASKYLDNISGNIQALKDAVARLNLSDTLKKQFDELFQDLGSNLKKAKSMVTQSSNSFTKASKSTVNEVSTSFDKLGNDLNKLSNKLQKEAKKTSEEVKKDTQDAEATVLNALTNIRSAVAMLGITKLTKEILNAASEAERALFALNKIFKSNAAEAQAMAESLSDMYALSEASASRQLADASKILDTYNLSDDVLLNMSSNMVALSQDLSAFTGGAVDASRAMSAVEAALNSDYRALKKTFGIFINDDTIKNLAKRWGLEAENLNTTQKVLLRYQAVMEATTNVSGTFAESQNSLYVTEQELKAAWEDLQVVLGEKLLPTVVGLAKALTVVIDTMSSFGVGTILASAAAVVAVVTAVTKLQLAIHKLKLAFDALNTTLGPVGWVVVAVSALLPIISSVIRSVKTAREEADAQARSTEVLTSNVEAYTAAEKGRKEAVDETTKSMLALEAASKADELKSNAKTLIKDLQDETANERIAGSTISGKQNLIASYKQQLAQALADNIDDGMSETEAAEAIANSSLYARYKAAIDELGAAQDDLKRKSEEVNTTLVSLANTYVQLSSINEDGAFADNLKEITDALTPEQADAFNQMVDRIKKGLPALVEGEDIIRQLAEEYGFVEQNWDKLLEKSSTQLENSREALKKQSDEYRKIRDDALSALDDEYTESVWAIDDQIEALNKRKANSPNPEAIDEEIARLEESKKKAEQWYRENYEYYNNVYAKNIQTAAEQLETKLAALVYKREQNITEQEAQTVSDLKAKWEDYAKTFNASIGGSTDIGSVGTSRSSLDAYIESIKGMEGVTEETITALTIAWETYYGSLGDIEDYYARLRTEKMRELEDALLAVELSAVNLSEEAKYDIQKKQLDRQHEAELEELEREYKDAAEYASMKAVLEEKHRKEDENAEKEHQKRLTEIAISEATARINRIANAVSSANMDSYDASRVKWAGGFALSAAQRGNREESRFSALGYDSQTAASMQAVVLNAENKLLSATTAEEEENIKAEMYDELYKLAVKYADNLDDLRDKIRQESLNDVELTYKARQELEMQNLEDEKKEALGKIADKNSDMYKLTEEWYNKRINNLTKKQADDAEKITREQNKALVASQKELLYDKEALYEADKTALEEELAYELAQADKNGKDKVLIEAMYNNKLEKLRRDHYVEMASITRQYSSELLNARISNNAARGGWFDLVANAYDRRLQSRKQTAMGLTDYVGGIAGINTEVFQKNASTFDEKFNTMLRKSLIIGSEEDKAEREAELKEQFRGMLDEVEYAGEDFELIWGNVWEKMKESTQSELDAMGDIVSNSLDKMADIFSKIDSLYSMAEQNRMQNLQNMLTDLQNQQDKLEKEASDSGRKLTKNEKDELQRRQDLYEEQIERQEELIKQEQERQFERQKAFSIAEATIQGIQAAVKSFSDNGGWPWGLVAAGLSATFTAAQIAMIKAQPMPSYAQGAYELPEDQTAQVHKGEMIVPKPFAEELRDKGGLGGEITVNVYGASEDATVENTVDSDGMQQLDIFVSGKVKGMVMRGELDAVLQSRYTLQRNGKRG